MATPSVNLLPARHGARSAFWLTAVVLVLSGCGATTTTSSAPEADPAVAGKAAAPAGKAAAPAGKTAAPAGKAGAPAGKAAAPAGKAGAPAGKAAAPAGKAAAESTLIKDASHHFSVRLPAGYKQLTKAKVKALLKAGGATNPQLKPIIDQYVLMGGRARVFAYKPGAGGTNVNILAAPSKGAPKDLNKLFAGVKPVVEKFGARVSDHGVENVAGTKAMRVEYRMSTISQRLRGTQVYLFHRGNAIVVTITQPDLETSSPDAKAIIGSLRLL